jgi:hypothetical protein
MATSTKTKHLKSAVAKATPVIHPGVEFEGLVGLSRRFGLSRVTMWRLYKAGAFEARRFGNKTLVRVADVRRYLDGLPTVPSKAA